MSCFDDCDSARTANAVIKNGFMPIDYAYADRVRQVFAMAEQFKAERLAAIPLLSNQKK